MSDEMEIFNTAVIRVFFAHISAVALTFTNIEWFLKLSGLAVALGFAIWQWVIAMQREKRLRKKEENHG